MDFKNFKELVKSCRSVRRFKQDEIDSTTLKELVNIARFSPSAANLQPLRFIIVNNPNEKKALYPALAWAGYIKDWDGPQEGERPAAYLIILGDTTVSEYLEYDAGIAAQSILLGARCQGLSCCILGALDRDLIRKEFKIPEKMKIILVLALGKPAEEVVIDENNNDPVTYYRDNDDIHHVPKRKLNNLIADYS
ncbi:MAG: nitroreductase family protein [bacterium]